jgi:hypothetical protein
MVARLEIEVLQNNAFNQIQASLEKEETRLPNPEFIAGLFKDDVLNKRLERYVIHHCAFYLKAGELADWKAWSRSLKADDRFRTAVVLHIAKINSQSYSRSKFHPSMGLAQTLLEDSEVGEDTDKLVSPHALEVSHVVLICFSGGWTPPGKTILLNTKSLNTIYEVKCMIADKEGVPLDGQRLRFEGTTRGRSDTGKLQRQEKRHPSSA